MRVLVCGGRDFEDYKFLSHYLTKKLDEYYVWSPDPEPHGSWGWDLFLIHGAARGADLLAEKWAQLNYIPYQEYPADWAQYGKRAGYLRNVQMLEEGKPDLVIAFPGGAGTNMMINLAKNAGVPVEEVVYEADVH